jgi:Zn-dependent protease with chaperone function
VIFLLRGLAVSLAFYVAVYTALSLLVVSGWELARNSTQNFVAKRRADLLFALRVLPVIGAGVFTLAFVVPSFLDFEPRRSAELVGELPLALGSVGLLVLSAGAVNAIAGYRKTSRTVNNWLAGATLVSSRAPVPVFRTPSMLPVLTLAGIRSHKVLLSETAAALLTRHELEAALQHEVAHARRRDNLRKLLFRFCAFPGMSRLETAWAEAEEMSADDTAVSSAQDAVELASALIKLSRLAPVAPSAALTTSLVHHVATSVNNRVRRLMTWDEDRLSSRVPKAQWYVLGVLSVLILPVIANYGAILRAMHALTEWMVR